MNIVSRLESGTITTEKQLIRSMNYEVRENEVLEGILNNLTNDADYHFAAEEKEMLKHNYPDYTEYIYKHQKTLSNWINNHITGTDKRYNGSMNSVGVN